MKRIAIFCDGTWNRHDSKSQTNVVRMARAVKQTADDKISQQIFYFMGVGSGRGSNALARFTDRAMGGALGWGLIQNIEDAYRSLVFSYEPGDEIYIFGFSRGAYTARSLAGLLRAVGICPRENAHRIPEAIEEYRRPKHDIRDANHPSKFLWRAEFAPDTATTPEELAWRQKSRPGNPVLLDIKFLGVWDTVGAMGVPGYWMAAPLLNSRHQFHDTELSETVKSARHAVALDERRKTFPPTQWSNLEFLNAKRLGLPTDLPLDPDTAPNWDYREEWFPGDHGSIGGGGDQRGLAAYSFDWVAEGAQAAGLDLRPEVRARIEKQRNILGPLNATTRPRLPNKLLALSSKDRDGPHDLCCVADAARERFAKTAGAYQPGALRWVIARLQALLS
ncbi:DUF2235 domain-containing protein [Yoonia sp. R2331]|uniref:DUF2235 domain-containing protein n=1 Tax=Yoonia sp. R2331 TaxID=3237238 RepID=UPI0034E4E664